MSSDGKIKYKEFELHASSRPSKNEWNIDAYVGDWKAAGSAEFVGVYEYGDDASGRLIALKGWNVEVKPAYRRKGLATAMYAFAEQAFGLPIVSGDFQTKEGSAFTRKRK